MMKNRTAVGPLLPVLVLVLAPLLPPAEAAPATPPAGEALLRVNLRARLTPCVQAAVRAGRAGRLTFSFLLHPDGGARELQIEPSGFAATGLPGCLGRVLGEAFAGPAAQEPVRVEGALWLAGRPAGRFGFSLSVGVSGQPDPNVRPPGVLERRGETLVSSCALGDARLALRLGRQRRAPVPLALALERARAEACEQNLKAEPAGGWTAQAWDREREVSFRCLASLLGDPSVPARQVAIERLGAGVYWQGRRLILAALQDQLRQIASDPAAGSSEEQGLGLLNLVKGALKLSVHKAEEAQLVLAAHPSRNVRLRLAHEVFSGLRGKIPGSALRLLGDADPVVRAVVANTLCQAGDRRAREVFLKDLHSAAAVDRAAAMLYARGCIPLARRAVEAAADREVDPAVALIMLLPLPDVSGELRDRRARAGRAHPCPIVRFLAERFLSPREAQANPELGEGIQNGSRVRIWIEPRRSGRN